MPKFDYKQRAATPEYRKNCERIFNTCAHDLVTYRFGNAYCIACGQHVGPALFPTNDTGAAR
jgi:hypothetical protein